jgi:hypothetical protein
MAFVFIDLLIVVFVLIYVPFPPRGERVVEFKLGVGEVAKPPAAIPVLPLISPRNPVGQSSDIAVAFFVFAPCFPILRSCSSCDKSSGERKCGGVAMD